ncbi:phage major capsid protein [Mycobacterium sp. MYCO198283]|uniref:phage major capsid protein n=1 Tax=Mycobacterium sp. MYCO198283 TaxID=2883505 RepID=UPI001E31BB07|nr:phage major capsid protein [Mycobacterium sp. MYCO198283]MCG5431801.1 phage major capsid protein [Mycobacterium sp. MYCO198283]
MSGIQEQLDRLVALRDQAAAKVTAILDNAEGEGRTHLTPEETTEWRQRTAHIAELDELIEHQRGELQRSGKLNHDAQRVRQASGQPGGGAESESAAWAQRAAQAIHSMGGEGRALTSGAVDVPRLVEPTVTPMARPKRLIDLLVNRKQLEGNAFEYFRQTVRTNNAAPVADNALKPTSVLTTTAVQDRARVIAHLSEPAPIRLLQDVEGLEQWLATEMAEGVLDALERQVIVGNGTGENMLGVRAVPGTTQVAYATSVPTTMRKALSALQLAGEAPNAVVMHPTDAETVDLTRWGTDGGFLTGGYANDPGAGFGTSANIFGGPEIQRVISPSVPAGTALLADWSVVRLYVREAVNVLLDMSGELFTKNQFIARGEGRFGLGVLRPSAIAVIDLTP